MWDTFCKIRFTLYIPKAGVRAAKTFFKKWRKAEYIVKTKTKKKIKDEIKCILKSKTIKYIY